MLKISTLTDLAKAATAIDSNAILAVDVSSVQSKEQVRKTFRNIEELAESMNSEGQQMPIVVSPMDSKGKYIIQKGERRWRAIKHAGIKTIDVIVNYRDQSTADAIAGELIENIQREDLDSIEIAFGIKSLLDNGLTREEISARLGKSASYVSSHLTLTKLPSRVLELCTAGLVTDVETLNNLRSLHNTNQDRCELVCSIMVSEGHGITRQQSRDILREEKDRKKNEGEALQVNSNPDSLGEAELAHDTNNDDSYGESSEADHQPTVSDVESTAHTGVGVKDEGQDKVEIQGELSHEILGSTAAPIEADLEGATTGVSPAKTPKAQADKVKSQEEVTIRVSMLTEMDVLDGSLILKECDDPENVWVRLDSGKKVQTHHSNVELRRIEVSK